MKNILVPTDFSKQADKALEVATGIAKKLNAKLVILNIVPMLNPVVLLGETDSKPIEQQYTEYVKDSADKSLENLIQEDRFKGLKVSKKVVIGEMCHQILEQIDIENIDLIVMGSSGSGGLDEWLIGSNTEKVVRNSTVPVLTIKESQTDFEVKNIVFASTMQENQLAALQKIQTFQEMFNAHLHLLYVNTPSTFMDNKDIAKRKDLLVAKTGLQNYTLSTYASVTEQLGIAHFSEEVKADVIALATNQRKGLAHFFIGSLTEDIVNHFTKPILSVAIKS